MRDDGYDSLDGGGFLNSNFARGTFSLANRRFVVYLNC
jgi:hypothetical protein